MKPKSYLAQRRVDIGQNVRRVRRYMGWTQEQVAEHLACSRHRVSRVERGELEYYVGELELLAKAFDIPLSQLLKSPTLETLSEKQKF